MWTNYGARNVQVVINGYTGAIPGKYAKSWIKITLAVQAVLTAVGVFLCDYHLVSRSNSRFTH